LEKGPPLSPADEHPGRINRQIRVIACDGGFEIMLHGRVGRRHFFT